MNLFYKFITESDCNRVKNEPIYIKNNTFL